MANANIDPKQYQHILDLAERRKKLEASIKEDMEKGVKLSGVAYDNHKKTLKSRGEELKALKKQIEAVNQLVDTEEAREFITEKDKLKKLDINEALKDQKKITEALKKLDINKANLSKKELQKQKESLVTAGIHLDKNIDAANSLQEQVKAQDKLLDLIGQSSSGVAGMARQAKLFVIAMAKNPIVLMLAGLAMIGKFLLNQFKLVKNINNELGVGVWKAKAMGDEFRLTNDALKLIGKDAVSIMGELQTEFGDLDKVTPSLVGEIGVMSTFLGASTDSLAKITGMTERLGGDTKDAGMNTIIFATALADANKVAPGKVLEDIADNTELFAEFGKDGGQNIARAAVAARKLGLDLGSVAKIADTLLDFETSIGSEMEASMLIGKQLNFNKARELALSGDLVGAAQDVVAQIGGQAELEQMNVIQRRALADSIGVSVEELSRLAGGKMTLEDPTEDVQQKLANAHDGTQKVMETLGTKMDALKVATWALVGVMTASTLMKGFDMFKGKGNIFRGTRVAKSTGMLDKTKGLGRSISQSRIGRGLFGNTAVNRGLGKTGLFGGKGATNLVDKVLTKTGGAGTKAGGLLKAGAKRIPGASAIFGGLSIAGGVKALKAGDKQKGGKNIGQGAGAIVGGALGTFLGPVGTMVGSAIGGWVGGKLGGAIGKWRENAAKRKAAEEENRKTAERLGFTKTEESKEVIEQNNTLINQNNQILAALKNVGKDVANAVTKE